MVGYILPYSLHAYLLVCCVRIISLFLVFSYICLKQTNKFRFLYMPVNLTLTFFLAPNDLLMLSYLLSQLWCLSALLARCCFTQGFKSMLHMNMAQASKKTYMWNIQYIPSLFAFLNSFFFCHICCSNIFFSPVFSLSSLHQCSITLDFIQFDLLINPSCANLKEKTKQNW